MTKVSLLSPRKLVSCSKGKKHPPSKPLPTFKGQVSFSVFILYYFFSAAQKEMGVLGICGSVKSLQVLNDA